MPGILTNEALAQEVEAAKPAARLLHGARSKIELPGRDRLLSDFAAKVGAVCRDQEIFRRDGRPVVPSEEGTALLPISPQTFRTWVERFMIGYRLRSNDSSTVQFSETMNEGDARGVLASPQFLDCLRPIESINPICMPIIHHDGRLALLPRGYDPDSRTLTVGEFTPEAMTLEQARSVVNELLAEFCFVNDRSKSVQVAGMLTIFGRLLLPADALRPSFFYVANCEGAGKSLLVKVATVPVLGTSPTGAHPKDEDEMRKALLAIVREARVVLLLDNLKGNLSSEALEGFLTAQVWHGRVLGVSETFSGRNLATVFVTGNGCTVSPDMRRRSLFVELHMQEERAEDRQFKRPLEAGELLANRSQILSALWTMIQAWDHAGRPGPSRGHASFPHWAQIIGGIVEHAGFGCCLETAEIATAGDTEGRDMRSLMDVLTQANDRMLVSFDEVVMASRDHGLFADIIGTEGELDRREKSRFGKLLGRYDRRSIGGCRFTLQGKGKTRRYEVQRLNGA